jgi:serine/threonine protein kinase
MMGRTGRQLGNYRLLQLLGNGGFADVYLGEHIYLKTRVAIKVLHAQLTHDSENFYAEARLIASLAHPHIVRVLDFGVENTIPYLVMGMPPTVHCANATPGVPNSRCPSLSPSPGR